MGPVPLPLGELARKSGFWPIFSMKTALYRLFGFEARSPKEEHRVKQLWLDSGWYPKCLMTTGYYAYIGSSSLGWGPRWMRIRFMGNFTAPIKWIFNFSIGVPIHKKKSRDEITIVIGTGKIPKRKDTICGSPSLFSFIDTKSKDSKNDAFDTVCRGSLLLRGHKKRNR